MMIVIDWTYIGISVLGTTIGSVIGLSIGICASEMVTKLRRKS